MATISITPMLTTGASTAFVLETDGFVQGTYWDDPAMRYQLEGGVVSPNQATPIWGGLPLQFTLPALGPGGSSSGLGPSATVATTGANINGWCLYNQAAAMMITASSNAPQAVQGMSINFARPGSLLRIALPVNPANVSAIISGGPNQVIYWDFVNNWLSTTVGGVALNVTLEFLNTNSKTVAYTPASGATNWNYANACAIVRI